MGPRRETVRARPAAAARLRLRGALPLALPLLVGASLRLWNLNHQIFLGDELHAVRSALGWSFPRILTTYRLADDSIPLTALYRLLAQSGVVLSEPVLRLPSIASGLALLVLLPSFVRAELGQRTALCAAWLVAISPTLVAYSRIARPYAPITFLALASLASFWVWWERRAGWRWALVYCLSGAAAIWMHPGAAPLVVTPLGFAAADVGRRLAGRRPDARAKLRGLLLWTSILVALVACFLVPARASFLRLLRMREGASSPTAGTVLGALSLQAGAPEPWLAAVFWTIALAGLIFLLREKRRLALYTASAVAAQWVAIALILRPTGVELPIVLSRYVLVTLTLVLLWGAFGLGGLGQRLARLRVPAAGLWLPALFVSVLAWEGPFRVQPRLHFGPFADSNRAVALLGSQSPGPAPLVPRIYRLLAGEPGSEPVLEAPRSTSWWANRKPLAGSLVHRRDVILGSDEPYLEDPRLRLRTVVPLDPLSLAASGARFVVVDRDARPRVTALPDALSPQGRVRGPRRPMTGADLVRRLQRAWGRPTLVDGSLRVWDLEKVRLRRRSIVPKNRDRRPGRDSPPQDVP